MGGWGGGPLAGGIAGGMMQPYRGGDKYARALESQLFVITEKQAHYVTLQSRLATFVVI